MHVVWASYLLSRSLLHVELDVLQISSLRDLPVNTADIGIGVGVGNVDQEVSDRAQEIVGVDVPDQC
jgi:hypothetical protein